MSSPPSQICYEIETLFGRLKSVTVTTHVNSHLLFYSCVGRQIWKFVNLSEHDDWFIDETLLSGAGEEWLVVFSKFILLVSNLF